MLDKLLRLPGVHWALAFLLARRAIVRGPSMSPTLAPGEYVLFDRLAYRRAPPRRGEVVLATDPRQPARRIIKRIAGGSAASISWFMRMQVSAPICARCGS